MPHKETHQKQPRRQPPPPEPKQRKAEGASSQEQRPRRGKAQQPELEEHGAAGITPEEQSDYDEIEEELLADEADSIDEEDAELAGVGASSLRRSGDIGEEEEEEEELLDEERASRGKRDDIRRH